MEKKFTIPPAAAIYWSIAVVLVAFAYFNLIPIALFQKMKTKGVLDAQNQIGLIENLDSEKFKEGGINFVEIAREKSEPVWGAAISCTEKFCALYSSRDSSSILHTWGSRRGWVRLRHIDRLTLLASFVCFGFLAGSDIGLA